MNITLIPYLITIIAFLIYLSFIIKKIKKSEEGYYNIIFLSIKILLLVPFWIYIIGLSIYLYFPKTKVFIENTINQRQTLVIKNDTKQTQQFYFLKKSLISKKVERDFRKDTVKITEYWNYAYNTRKFDIAVEITIQPRKEKKVYLDIDNFHNDKLFIIMKNNSDSTFDDNKCFGKLYKIQNKAYYIYAKDFKERVAKITPEIKTETNILILYIVVFIAFIFHILQISGGWKKRVLFYTLSIVIFAPIGWIIYNYGKIFWIYFFY